MKCLTCNRTCDCPRHIHSGESRVQVPLSARELEHLLKGQSDGDVYLLYLKLERALELLQGST